MSADLERALHRLVASVREDIAAHERIAEILGRQESSVRRPSSDEFTRATADLQAELGGAPARTARRDRALSGVAGVLGVPPFATTLGSVVLRAGDRGTALAQDRERLRELADEVDRRGRRVATLVRLHRQVARDLLQVVLGQEDGEDVHAGGSLIDAEV